MVGHVLTRESAGKCGGILSVRQPFWGTVMCAVLICSLWLEVCGRPLAVRPVVLMLVQLKDHGSLHQLVCGVVCRVLLADH